MISPGKYDIRHDYKAVNHSGVRQLNAIEWLVLHDMESTNETGAAEGTGSWFERVASGASTHYGMDNNSIQQYLPITVIPWGAPGANTNGIHYEQMGKAAWTREQWMEHAKGTLDRCAWLLAKNYTHLREHGVIIPLRHIDDNEVRAHRHGIVTHRQLTRALGIGTHTDPGTGYPLEWVIDRARYYAGVTK